MKYTFNYSDGRNYKDKIVGTVKIGTENSSTDKITLEIFSKKERKIKFQLSRDEAVVIGHALLSATDSNVELNAIITKS